jgi:hypothetical protein
MKKTINGTIYDDEKAEYINTRVFGSGINYTNESLFMTPRSGRYFLSGKGGINTKYAGKERIIPITREYAEGWLND